MTETTVTYHRDGFGPGRPAVNVKVHAAGVDFRSPEVDAGMPEDPTDPRARHYPLTDAIHEEAYNREIERFWADAAIMAEELGLGPIEQAGRSGGWLVLTDGRDPANEGTLTEADTLHGRPFGRKQWLAAYRKLRDWCDAEVAACPGRVAALAQSLAMDEAAQSSVTLQSWLAFGKEYPL